MTFPGSITPLYASETPTDVAETMPLDGLMRRHTQDAIRSLRTAFPAAIIAVGADQTVDVQPLLQVRYAGQDASSMRPIPSVPVVMPQGKDYRLSYPLAVGDTGLVVVADRSLDAWLAGQGDIVDPLDSRSHHIADAIFVPGLVPSALQTADTGTDMVLGNGALSMRLLKSGKISVNNTTQELVQVLHDSMQLLISTLSTIQGLQVLGPFGPQPLLVSSIAQFAQLQAKMSAILSRLDTFKV